MTVQHSQHRAALVPAPVSRALALAELDARAHDYAAAAHAPNTIRAYAADLRAFAAWGRALQLVTLPADPRTVARYLAALADAGRKCSTIGRALTAINVATPAPAFPGPGVELGLFNVGFDPPVFPCLVQISHDHR